MATQVLSETKYSKLVRDIRRLIEEGKARAAAAASQELVLTYWQIGKRIVQENLSTRSGYKEAILRDLSEELDIEYSTLIRIIQFFKAYKVAPRGNRLMWAHYKALIPLTNTAERKWYEELVKKDGLTRDQLANAIREGRYQEFLTSKGKTKPKKLKRPTEATYVYKALVERVVDGDTLLLRIDLGFQVFKEQRVRLAAIDTPAVDQPKGREAYTFVRDQLAKVAFVMVKTNKIDVYGRYVGHIFYSLKTEDKNKIFSEGRYLNQELLDRGLARII